MALPNAVYFYGTCVIDLLYPEAGLAGMDLIRSAGIQVRYPRQQTCCGQPAFNSGYRDEALRVARAQLTCFPDPFPIVVPSASCAGMMKHHWPELFAGQRDETKANDIAGRVFELTEFLVDVVDLKLTDLGAPLKVAVHTSCSARREMGVGDRIRSLLGQLEKVQIVEHEHEKECCGFGGTFSVKQPDISGAMVTDKSQAIAATGADTLLSQDCSCLMNISGALEKQAIGPSRSLHIAQFLMERTHGSDD